MQQQRSAWGFRGTAGARCGAAAAILLAGFGWAGAARAVSFVDPSVVHDLFAEVVLSAAPGSSETSTPDLPLDGTVEASDATDGIAGSAFASQFSSLSTDGFANFGSANASGVFFEPTSETAFHGRSRVVFSFSVSEDTSYSIDYALTVSESRGDGLAQIRFARLLDPTPLFASDQSATGDTFPTHFEGSLQAGEVYELEAQASTDVVPGESLSGTAAAGYTIHFSIGTIVVPEPGTAASVGAGLAVLVWLGRRARL